MGTDEVGAPTRIWRGARRRCPNCGSQGLFRRWIVMESACPSCRLKLDRGEADYFIGAFTVNFVAAELLIMVGAAVGLWLTWPDVPWGKLQLTLLAVMIPGPILFYPFAKTLWLALDLSLRPLVPSDLEEVDGPPAAGEVSTAQG